MCVCVCVACACMKFSYTKECSTRFTNNNNVYDTFYGKFHIVSGFFQNVLVDSYQTLPFTYNLELQLMNGCGYKK